MANQILLNNEVYQTKEEILPCLVTYKEKSGGSDFSVTMIADLFLHGSKILFLTAYPMAKDNFMEQIKGNESKVVYITDEKYINTDTQAIILESGNEKLFLKAVEKLEDINERIILIKNMEVFGDTVIDSCLKLQKIIISGDIDKCSSKEKIISNQFKMVVVFSTPEIKLPFNVPELEKYVGYLWSEKDKGAVKIIKD